MLPAAFDRCLLQPFVMRKFIEHRRAKISFEFPLARARSEFLAVIVTEIGLEDTSRTHGQEVFIDDRIKLHGAKCHKRFDIQSVAR